jgi:hypothetical protein
LGTPVVPLVVSTKAAPRASCLADGRRLSNDRRTLRVNDPVWRYIERRDGVDEKSRLHSLDLQEGLRDRALLSKRQHRAAEAEGGNLRGEIKDVSPRWPPRSQPKREDVAGLCAGVAQHLFDRAGRGCDIGKRRAAASPGGSDSLRPQRRGVCKQLREVASVFVQRATGGNRLAGPLVRPFVRGCERIGHAGITRICDEQSKHPGVGIEQTFGPHVAEAG